MPAKRFPLPKRFNCALSEKAYENLRGLNAQYGYGKYFEFLYIKQVLEDQNNLSALII